MGRLKVPGDPYIEFLVLGLKYCRKFLKVHLKCIYIRKRATVGKSKKFLLLRFYVKLNSVNQKASETITCNNFRCILCKFSNLKLGVAKLCLITYIDTTHAGANLGQLAKFLSARTTQRVRIVQWRFKLVSNLN